MEGQWMTAVIKRNCANRAEWVEYKVPANDGMTVLGVLDYIYEHIDSSLAFYKSCRRGRCKGCWVAVDGKPVLSCEAMATEGMRISAVEKFAGIRDLVVDFRKSSGVHKKEARD